MLSFFQSYTLLPQIRTELLIHKQGLSAYYMSKTYVTRRILSHPRSVFSSLRRFRTPEIIPYAHSCPCRCLLFPCFLFFLHFRHYSDDKFARILSRFTPKCSSSSANFPAGFQKAFASTMETISFIFTSPAPNDEYRMDERQKC